MESLVADNIGLTHLISSIFALIFGTLVLLMTKGNRKHVRIGYAYIVSMAIVIATAFMIYRLFGGFGIFHFAAMVSLLGVILGMIPVLTKWPISSWKLWHLSFMYWSVIGLYAAFASELLTRIPQTPFLGMVGVATFAIMVLGGIFFRRNSKKWMEPPKEKI